MSLLLRLELAPKVPGAGLEDPHNLMGVLVHGLVVLKTGSGPAKSLDEAAVQFGVQTPQERAVFRLEESEELVPGGAHHDSSAESLPPSEGREEALAGHAVELEFSRPLGERCARQIDRHVEGARLVDFCVETSDSDLRHGVLGEEESVQPPSQSPRGYLPETWTHYLTRCRVEEY